MTLSIKKYLDLRDATVAASSTLYAVLEDMDVPLDGIDHANAIESPWGRAAFEGLSRRLTEETGTPHLIVPNEITGAKPVISTLAFAKSLKNVLAQFRLQLRAKIIARDESPSLKSFGVSLETFLNSTPPELWRLGMDASSSMFVDTAQPETSRLPLEPDLRHHVAGGLGEIYKDVDPSLLTAFTLDQIYLEQLTDIFQRLAVTGVDEALVSDLPAIRERLVQIIHDLRSYYLENETVASAQTERVQQHLFNRDVEKIYVGRLHLNMSSANHMKPGGDRLGNLFLDAVRSWLIDKFPEGHIIQNPERTTFQFVIPEGMDATDIFSRFSTEIKRRLYVLNRNRPQKDRVSPAVIKKFEPKGIVAKLPISRKNILAYAIQNPEDIDSFREVLLAMGHKERALEMIKSLLPNNREAARSYLLAYADLETVLATTKTPLRLGLHALLLHGIHHYSRYLAGATTFFEKKRGGLGASVAVFTEGDIPVETDDAYDDFRTFAEGGVGFVSDGTYDPVFENPALARGLNPDDLPQLKYREGGDETKTAAQLRIPEGAHRLLRAFDRPNHIVGRLTHAPRRNIPDDVGQRLWEVLGTYLDASSDSKRAEADEAFRQTMSSIDWKEIPERFRAGMERRFMEATRATTPEAQETAKTEFCHILSSMKLRESFGGYTEQLFIAMDQLEDAKTPNDKMRALRLVQFMWPRFLREARGIWARSAADFKYPLALKPRGVFEVGAKTLNSASFTQELARSKFRNLAILEYDSFQAWQHAHQPTFNDSRFQEIRDFIYIVAADWDMPMPIMSPLGGDLVTFAFPDKTRDGKSVDAVSFLYEIQRRIFEKYKDDPYQDRKKVDAQTASLSLSTVVGREALDAAVREAATRLNLQAIPYINMDKHGRLILETVEGDAWAPVVQIRDVIADLIRLGLPIESFEINSTVETARLPIWEVRSEDETIKYRFGHVGPQGAKPFMKTLSATIVGTTIDTPRSLVDAEAIVRRIDMLSDLIDARIKGMAFPHKGALVFDGTTILPTFEPGESAETGAATSVIVVDIGGGRSAILPTLNPWMLGQTPGQITSAILPAGTHAIGAATFVGASGRALPAPQVGSKLMFVKPVH